LLALSVFEGAAIVISTKGIIILAMVNETNVTSIRSVEDATLRDPRVFVLMLA
jgi:hypothetical protein